MCNVSKKNISKLLENNKKVYIYLRNHEVFKQFVDEAEKEGFLFSDGKKPSKKKYSDILAINNDFAICYVTYVGRLNFKSPNCNTPRVDYQKFTNDWEDYSYKTKDYKNI